MVNVGNHLSSVTGIVLAGGRGTRMNGVDKGLVELRGRPIISHIVEKLRPQVDAIVINANRNHQTYQTLTDTSVVADDIDGFLGPLAGMVTGMTACNSRWVLTVPCDSPFLSSNLCEKLMNAAVAAEAEICVAHDGVRLQPVFALISTNLENNIRRFLSSGGRKIDQWYKSENMATCDFSDEKLMFANVNTPADKRKISNELKMRQP